MNPTNGTSSLSLPLPLSPGRNGFSPALALQYNSGMGNGLFGIGWELRIPSVQLKTDKGLPTYTNTDTYQWAGEDLVPHLKRNNTGIWEPHTTPESDYTITRYRPRRESVHDKIERIEHPGTGTYWKITDRNNVVTFFGPDVSSRIADPADPRRVFKWLAAFSYDNKGNYILYEYKKEDLENVPKDLHESHRMEGRSVITNVYLKRIKYGNKSAFYADASEPYTLSVPPLDDYSFELVIDYGEHDLDFPGPTASPNRKWDCRTDPFSSYRAGFEIRTYRICKRILMFHHFDELGEEPCLVKSLELEYTNTEGLENTQELSEATYLSAATLSGYIRQEDERYSKKSFPPVTLEYQPLEWNTKVECTSGDMLENTPVGFTYGHQLVDLYGEGVPGILCDQGEAWYYRNNLGDFESNGVRFSPMNTVAHRTSIGGFNNGKITLQDLEANGQKQLVVNSDGLKGFHPLNELEGKVEMEPDGFTPFTDSPNINWRNTDTRFIDLNGDGKAELVVSEESVFLWYESLGKQGYRDARTTLMPFEEEDPAPVFADTNESIHLADISGDGLTDIVRIRNGEVCYWPNLGYGKFGNKVTMSDAPLFDRPDSYDPKRLHLADVSGTGATDMIYLTETGFKVYINLSGNGWSEAKEVAPFAPMDNRGKFSVADILGTGTACIIWSSDLPNEHPLRYIDLMDSKKPHLLTSYSNSMGQEVVFAYKHSTYYYLKAREEGRPWLTKLPFPVHVVDTVKVKDHISSSELATSYHYYHGFYDHEEREFRGFGRVDQVDQETFETYKEEDALDIPPVLTKTWTHLGSYLKEDSFSKQYQEEYYRDASLDYVFPDSAIESEGNLNYEDYREAVRNLKGMPLRQEVYTLDGTKEEAIPYSISENNYTISNLQPRQENDHGVYQVLPRETLTYTSERNTADPRISHQFALSHDDYGHPLQSLAVAYPRSSGIVDTHPEQMELHVLLGTMAYENEVEQYYRLGLLLRQKSFEVNGISLQPNTLLDWDDIQSQLTDILDGDHQILHHEEFTGGVESRLLSAKNVFYKEGNLRPYALVDHEEQMMMSEAWPTMAYDAKVDDAMLQEAGYFKKEGHWWVRSDILDYQDAAGFLMLKQSEDVFGNSTSLGYDSYYIGVIETEDALQNKIIAEIDYRTLAIKKTTDINDTVSETLTDELGMVIASTVYGTEAGLDKGDAPIEEYQRMENSFLENVVADPSIYLQGATTFFFYHIEPWEQGNLPPHFVSLQREKHVSELSEGEAMHIQISLGYTDGFGREMQSKVKHTEDSWLVSGRTLYNNKEKPVKQYEPFFSDTYLFQSEEEVGPVGVTPIMHYDALGRLIRTDFPDGFHSKVEFDPWQITSYDQNDTVLDSQAYLESANLPSDDPKKKALDKAALHYNTPTKVILDSLGREFRVEQSKEMGAVPLITYTEFDIQGNALSQTDPRQYTANLARSGQDKINNFSYTYDLLGNPLRTVSQDAGTTYTLLNAKGNPLYAWNAKGYRTKVNYDALHRPTETLVEGTGLDDPDLTITSQKIIYGTDRNKNQNGMPIITYDQSGKSENIQFDFKGQVLQATRQLCSAYKSEPDWQDPAVVVMEEEVYTTVITYDALGRSIKTILPDGSVHIPTYHHIGWLKGMEVQLRGAFFGTASTETPGQFVNDISYDAKGQRTKIVYGNGVSTSYTYDEKNYRLTRLLTQRQEANGGQTVLQDIAYVYDPVGNIVQITDNSHDRVFNAGQQVDPTMDFVYDALYQLTEATGREHKGLAKNTHQEHADVFQANQFVHVNDTNQLSNYTRRYTYDDGGNLIKLQHTSTNSFTRNFTVSDSNNRAITDEMDGSTPIDSYFDAAGNLLQLEHLDSISWNYRNHIASATIVERQIEDEEGNVVNISDAEYYVYDAAGQRTRKVKETYNTAGDLLWKEEKIYLGGVEVRKKYAGNTQQLRENRSTAHVMDDQKRIALVHYWEISNDTSVTPYSNKVHYQMGNHLGSASMELDSQGQLISYEEYFPFGGTSYTAGNNLAEVKLREYRYTGKEKDDTTGLYYYGARYYAPWIGRWLNPDPAGTVDGLNLFRYVRNNPLIFIDPTGEMFIWVYLSIPLAQAPADEKDIKEDNSGLYFWGGIGLGAAMMAGPAVVAAAPSAESLLVSSSPYAPYSGDAVNIAYGFISDDPSEIAPSISPVSSDAGVALRRGLKPVVVKGSEYVDDLLKVSDDIPTRRLDESLDADPIYKFPDTPDKPKKSASSATKDSSRDKSGPVEQYEVMTYGESAKKSAAIVGDNLTLDHVVSGAALKKHLQKINAGALSDKDLNFIYKEGQGIIISDALHKAMSRTYGGRNTAAQIASDVSDLKSAMLKDLEALRQGIIKSGGDVDAFNKAADELIKRQMEIFEIGGRNSYRGVWEPN